MGKKKAPQNDTTGGPLKILEEASGGMKASASAIEVRPLSTPDVGNIKAIKLKSGKPS